MSSGGMSRTRLARMHDVMARHVDSGEVPGLVTLISRHGEGQESEIEIRQLFELEDFAPSPAIDQARELEKQLAKNK